MPGEHWQFGFGATLARQVTRISKQAAAGVAEQATLRDPHRRAVRN